MKIRTNNQSGGLFVSKIYKLFLVFQFIETKRLLRFLIKICYVSETIENHQKNNKNKESQFMNHHSEDTRKKENERKRKGSVQNSNSLLSLSKKHDSLLFHPFLSFFPQKTSKLLKFFLFLCDVKPRVFLFLFEKKREKVRKGKGRKGREGK